MPELVSKTAQQREAKTEYVLKSGKHFGRDADGNEVKYSIGERVPLNEDQYAAFSDKFETVEEHAHRNRHEKDGQKPNEPAKDPLKSPGNTPAGNVAGGQQAPSSDSPKPSVAGTDPKKSDPTKQDATQNQGKAT